MGQSHSSAYSQPTVPAPLIENEVLSPFLVFVSFVKDQMAVDVWYYFCGLCSVPLVYISVLVPVPCCFGYCSVVV